MIESKDMNDLISVKEAESAVMDAIAKLVVAEKRHTLAQVHGGVLAETVRADRDLPPYDRVMMDGIVVTEADWLAGQREFDLAGLVAAGDAVDGVTLKSGEALEIMTGAVRPNGGGVIVPVEGLTFSEDKKQVQVVEECGAKPGKFIHLRGSDYKKGIVLMDAGSVLRSPEIGVLASCGVTNSKVRVMRVAVVTTGDELVPVEASPEAHQIRQSNGEVMAASLLAMGLGASLEVERFHFLDDEEALQTGLERVLEKHDVVVVCGGISKGRRDFVRPVLERLLGAPAFHGVRQRPGKPFGFWSSGKTMVFALPGNPVSAIVGLHQYVIPALRTAMWGSTANEVAQRTLAERFEFSLPLTGFVPVVIDKEGLAWPQPVRNSGDYASLVGTSGFVELPEREGGVFEPGEAFRFSPWI